MSRGGPRIAHVQDFGWRTSGLFALLGLRPANALHTTVERDALQRAARDRRVIVEIGVFEGASAAELRQVMHPDGELVLVDPFHLNRLPGPLRFGPRIARRTVEAVERGRVTWIEEFSVPAAESWDRPIDMLFIDGDHSVDASRADWEAWTPWVRPGGVVAVHDALPPWVGPVQVVERAQKSPEWRVIDQTESVTVLLRQPPPHAV
jgi:predicted O-methyltransferase YrrM